TAGVSILNDTWEWDGVGAAWSQVAVVSPPGARNGAAMVFDAARARCALFGGLAIGTLGDTQEYAAGSAPVISSQPAGATLPAGRRGRAPCRRSGAAAALRPPTAARLPAPTPPRSRSTRSPPRTPAPTTWW